ncbi:MAG TPA: histidine kinase dimerization/phosphoacceptor domain -containing protein [Pseudolabrys sp.]|nr:histidine kinase dimerization/phosphoacceptor domain -containing protein [Pseudolabrys sp.]
MPTPEETSGPASQPVSELFESAELTAAVDTEDFKLFLDHVPIAIVIFKFADGGQRVVFCNKAYETFSGQSSAQIIGNDWTALDAFKLEDEPHLPFSEALTKCEEFAGTFRREGTDPRLAEAYASLIENEDGTENYRIVALIDVTERERVQREEFARQVRDKDLLLKELQHRVKNNLQLVTALIRLDARNQRNGDKVNLDRLAGRIESLQLLYQDLSAEGFGQRIDLGHYLSQISAAVMHTYAVEGIRLDLKVDHAPISINIAMPVGLLVNELLTNAFKYAFNGAASGTITLRCLHESDDHYRIVVADDGVGLPEGKTWPQPGKLGALILQSLRENASTEFSVESAPGKGLRVSIGIVYKPRAKKPN